MVSIFVTGLEFLNQLLTAGIAITAFSLLLYALAFNLRDRVARSFAIILTCVVVVFVGDAIASATLSTRDLEFWLRLEWVGIVFLPAAYLHFSDALLTTTGRPSRGRRRLAIRLAYLVSFGFLVTLPLSLLVGSLVPEALPAPHLQRTWLTWVFTGYYAVSMIWSWINFRRAYQRTVTSTSRRRMQYLVAGALAPALGSYQYLLFGSEIAARLPWLFWFLAFVSNLLVSILLVIMAYAVAFFGVSWPDRVVKRRLFKWLMRGPVTACSVLMLVTLVRRTGVLYGVEYSAAVPVVMVASILILEYLITLAAPYWERWLFHGGDRANMDLLQTLEDRLITTGDLRQFLEAVLAAVCDRMQVPKAFIAVLGPTGVETMVTIGTGVRMEEELPDDLLELAVHDSNSQGLFTWGNYWLAPLYAQHSEELVGLLGIPVMTEALEEEQRDALELLSQRAALALEDRRDQQSVFTSLQALTPQMDIIQRLRAAARYDSASVLTTQSTALENGTLSKWVKDALTHYWGGPKLTESPLLRLKIVQQALEEHEDSPVNALRAILRQAVEQVRPEGERRFTGEWILFNILEMKFMEGRKVREIAMRLAMSEADLYRKQRVAIEAVADAILEMEERAREEVMAESDLRNDKITVDVIK